MISTLRFLSFLACLAGVVAAVVNGLSLVLSKTTLDVADCTFLLVAFALLGSALSMRRNDG